MAKYNYLVIVPVYLCVLQGTIQQAFPWILSLGKKNKNSHTHHLENHFYFKFFPWVKIVQLLVQLIWLFSKIRLRYFVYWFGALLVLVILTFFIVDPNVAIATIISSGSPPVLL